MQYWLGDPLPPSRFTDPQGVSDSVPWLSARRTPTPSHCVQDLLRRSLATPSDAAPSLFALARSIPVSAPHIHRTFPALAARIVARHRGFCSQHKIARATRDRGLLREAVDPLIAGGLLPTPAAVRAHLRPRWPLSRHRLRAILSEFPRPNCPRNWRFLACSSLLLALPDLVRR